MRRWSVPFVLAVGVAVVGCGGSEPKVKEPVKGPRSTFTITKLDERSPARIRDWSFGVCSEFPRGALIDEAGGRTDSASIARAQASHFPRLSRKAAYAGCVEGLRARPTGGW
jgi:hypothetical protein